MTEREKNKKLHESRKLYSYVLYREDLNFKEKNS